MELHFLYDIFVFYLTWPKGSCHVLSLLCVRRLLLLSVSLYILIFFSETFESVGTKLGRNVNWMVFYTVCGFFLLETSSQKKIMGHFKKVLFYFEKGVQILKFCIFEKYIKFLFFFINFGAFIRWIVCVEIFRNYGNQ
jgi:hypothetical protein